MMKSILALFLVLFVVVSSEASLKRSMNIVGGNATYQGQIPFLVTLDLCGYLCGGFILDVNHIGTAAHCFNSNVTANCSVVTAGTIFNNDTSGQQIYAANFTVHPGFDNVTFVNDAAVITLNQSLTLNANVSIAVLANQSSQLPANGTNVYVAGWGATTENGTTSNTSLIVNLPYISNATQCAASGPYPNFTAGNQLCAGGQSGFDSCQGDSGGPLFTAVNATNASTGAVVIGIVSFGIGCARPGVAGVYTDVPNFAYAFFQSVLNPATLTASQSVNASSVAPSSVAPSSVVVASSSGAVVASSSGAVVASSSGAVVASSSGAVAPSSSGPAPSASGSGSKSQSNTPSNSASATTSRTSSRTGTNSKTGSSLCGNGVKEPGEQCEGGVCCSHRCKFYKANRPCGFRPAGVAKACVKKQRCNGLGVCRPAVIKQNPKRKCRKTDGTKGLCNIATGACA